MESCKYKKKKKKIEIRGNEKGKKLTELEFSRKELIRNQEKSKENWERKWGFMKNPRKLWEEEAMKRGLPPDIFEVRSNRRKPAVWSDSRKPTVELKKSTRVPVLASGSLEKAVLLFYFILLIYLFF